MRGGACWDVVKVQGLPRCTHRGRLEPLLEFHHKGDVGVGRFRQRAGRERHLKNPLLPAAVKPKDLVALAWRGEMVVVVGNTH